MKKEVKIPFIFYHYIHSKIKEKTLVNEISVKDAKKILFEWRIPKELRPVILKELEFLGLIEKRNCFDLIVKKSDIDLSDISKIYKMAGIFEWR